MIDLLEACKDWDGSDMPDGAEPRRIPTCGELRATAALIAELVEALQKIADNPGDDFMLADFCETVIAKAKAVQS